MTRDELVQLAGMKAEEYRQRGFHCSESVLRALAEVLNVDLGEDLERASTVFRGGGGGYGDRCGAMTGGVMLLSLIMGEKGAPEEEQFRRQLIEQMHTRFAQKTGSTMCGVIKPVAQLQWSTDQSCALTYQVGAETAIEVLLDQAKAAPDGLRIDLPVLSQVDG